ncbi:MAG TPA: DinB family protein [Pseudobacteroides sp.]|uniref:DinB family protein n=1 Tax=Pseudobacteroides sp. TaxID=1968840 RepID=UPI002F9423A3
MNIKEIIQMIKNAIESTFQEIDKWFEKSEQLRSYSPQDKGWTINEILEHISLTNHFLLILINKGTKKAIEIARKGNANIELSDYKFGSEKLDEIAIYNSFNWINPEHMEPTGEKALLEIRTLLKSQVNQCLTNLEEMANGEGTLYKTMMTVNSLGKIDVYHYIYFLAQHAKRHIAQMENVEKEYIKL